MSTKKNERGSRKGSKRSGKKFFMAFMRELEDQLVENGQMKTSLSYRCTRNSFVRFLETEDINMRLLTSDVIQAYEYWLKREGIGLNTISFYMRVLRAAYNRAVERGLMRQADLFKSVYTGVQKTRKRAIDEGIMHQLVRLDLTGHKSLDYARDLFLFSFYTRGMAFVDMAYLRKQDLVNGFIHYNRRKTGQRVSIKVEPCMMNIINKYESLAKESSYLLPILKGEDSRGLSLQHYNAIRNYNMQLKRITDILGLPQPITSYVSRHTWATVAKNKEIPISVISEGMGHTSIRTTQIYLASLEQSVLDKANEMIIADLLSP